MSYTMYTPLNVWLDPASITDVVAYIQTYLSENTIYSETEIETIIHDYLIAHPELIGGVQSVNGKTGTVVLSASDINTEDDVTIESVLASLSSQISSIAASVATNTNNITSLTGRITTAETDLTNLKSNLKYQVENPASLFEQGYWSFSQGLGGQSAVYVRSKTTVNAYKSVSISNTYGIVIGLLAYNGSTYIGSWNNVANTWEIETFKADLGGYYYDIEQFEKLYPNYTFKLTIRYISDNTEITPSTLEEKIIIDAYYNISEINSRVSSIEQDGWVTPERTSFLIHNKNYYDPSKVVNGYYVSTSGVIIADARFSYIAVDVPAGKTAFTSATINGTRSIQNSARFMCAKNKNGAVIGSGDDWNTASKYTNGTNDTVTVYFTLWYAHPTYTATDYMIQIVNSVDDVVLSYYVPFGYTFGDEIQIDLDSIEKLEQIIPLPKEYFEAEIETTAVSIMEKTVKPCLVYNIITDTHLRPSSADSVRQTFDSIANMTALNRVSYADAVVHLGDTVAQSMYTQDDDTNAEIFATMRKYVKRFSEINAKAFPINGNHDGIQANIYQQFEWYSIAGRLNTSYAVKDDGNNYFYVDYPDIKTRCVFLATPDNIEDASSAVYGYTPRLLNWLVNTALDVPNNYGVIMFAHISPFFTWYIPNGMSNRADFYGICNAFHSHTAYTGTVQSADFSGKSGTKLVAHICGHAHGDAVLTAGQTVSGVDENGNAVTTTNEMPCPVINIGCGLFSSYPMSNYGAVAPSRTDKTVTQDLWDTMIYRPDLNKIYMVRFGAGDDREITVN